VSWTYADVDRSDDPAGAAAWMDTMASWPSIRACKDRTVALLRALGRVLDVGCGVGDDVRAIGPEAIGIDASATMTLQARARGGTFARGDVHALPFAEASFGGARTERVLQHVEDPDTALRELARVVRTGGRLVLAEPDQSTLAISGTEPTLTPAIIRFRAESVRNGYLAADLPGRLTSLGFSEVHREPFTIEIDEPTMAFGLPSWPALLVQRGEWTSTEANRFIASLGSRAFAYRYDCVIVWGTK
jgi:ubiquinone/menaquinone biosynthesis C-methylase UbiE